MLSMGFIKKVYLFANKYFFIVNMGSKLSSQAFILYDSNSMIFWEKKKKTWRQWKRSVVARLGSWGEITEHRGFLGQLKYAAWYYSDGYLLLCICPFVQTHWASLVAHMVKNPPAMQETWVWFLGWEDPLKEGLVTHSSILAWRIPRDKGAWQATVHGVAKSRTWLSD